MLIVLRVALRRGWDSKTLDKPISTMNFRSYSLRRTDDEVGSGNADGEGIALDLRHHPSMLTNLTMMTGTDQSRSVADQNRFRESKQQS